MANISSNNHATIKASGTAVRVTGSSSNDRVEGNNLGNTVYGRGGSDKIFGKGGDDLMDGGHGRDSMYGGSGNDEYIIRRNDYDIINDASGRNDSIDATVYRDDEMDINALDMFRGDGSRGQDGKVDTLLIEVGHIDDEQIGFRILNYFDNSSKNPVYSDPGKGCIEYLVFDGALLQFDDIQLLAD